MAALAAAESNPDADADADAAAAADADVPHHAVPHHHNVHHEPYGKHGHHEPAPYAHHEPAPYAHPAPYTPTPSPYGYAEPAPYTPAPHYGHPKPHYPAPPHHPAPYGQQPGPPHGGHYYGPPRCSKGNDKTYCLEDYEYPSYDIQQAIEYNYDAVQKLYKDVLANTPNSVDNLVALDEETYLCPSEQAYIQPLRAVNVHGKWRIIVNDVKAHYETLSQTARVEVCLTPKEKCPLVAGPYDTKCIQKSVYHRFLVYDPYDEYLPFAIESFQLPSSCACFAGEYAIPVEETK